MLNLERYTKEFRYNLKLAYPVIIGLLGHTLVQLVDNIMVGQLGTAELAAISLGNSFIFIAMSIGIGFSTAITPLVAEADSSGQPKEIKSAFTNGLVWCVFLGLILALLVYQSKSILFYMGQPAEVVELAFPYLKWVSISLFPLIVFQAIKQLTDGLSMTRIPMYATLFANIVNVVINYVLIFGMWGFPKLGIVGAAFGTLASRVAMVLVLWFLLTRSSKARYFVTQLNFSDVRKKMLKKLFSLGFPSALQMLFEVSFFTAAVWVCGMIGKNAQAANQIALNLSSMTFMVAMGLGVVATIRVGNQKGKKQFRSLRDIAHSIFLVTLILDIIFAIFFIAFNEFLPSIYLDNSQGLDVVEVIQIASTLLWVSAFFQIFDGAQVVALGALRALHDVNIPTLITFIAYGLVGFPISFYLGLHTSLEATGVWIGLLSGLVVSSIMLYIRFYFKTQQLIKSNAL